MTWLLTSLLALLALAPLAWVIWRPAPALDRAAADRALYRAQIAELDRDRAFGRLDEAAHAAALLEVQRRLLAVPDAPATRAGARWPLLAGLAAIPALAFGLYVLDGLPDMPSATFAERRAIEDRDGALLAQLRERLSALPPGAAARQGWVLLAEAERARGRPAEAAAAFGEALRAGFEPELAAQRAQVLLEAGQVEQAAAFLAEALPRAPEHVGLRFLSGQAEAQAGRPAAARAVWSALIATAPDGVPWRGMVERRMQSLP